MERSLSPHRTDTLAGCKECTDLTPTHGLQFSIVGSKGRCKGLVAPGRTRQVKPPHPRPIFWVRRMEAFLRQHGIRIPATIEV